MNVEQLRVYYKSKNDTELRQKLNVSDVTLWKWDTKGIPIKTQCFLEIKTDGAVKADRSLVA